MNSWSLFYRTITDRLLPAPVPPAQLAGLAGRERLQSSTRRFWLELSARGKDSVGHYWAFCRPPETRSSKQHSITGTSHFSLLTSHCLVSASQQTSPSVKHLFVFYHNNEGGRAGGQGGHLYLHVLFCKDRTELYSPLRC